MKRYSEYKDSGVEWIGEIPSHWEAVGFTRYIDSIVDYRGKTPEKVEEGIFLVTTRNIKNGKLDYSLSQEYVLEEQYRNIMSRGIPEIGDVLFTMEAPLGEVANVDNTNIALAQRIIKLRGKKDKLDNYYLKYWILSSVFQQNLYTYATGSTALGIKSGKLHKLTIVLPTIQEQYNIVKYLDKKTLQIETLIRKKEELIEILKSSRNKIISETITKGIDKDVPMKDSGVDWIGKIPSHWEIKKLDYISDTTKLAGFEFTEYFDYIDNGEIIALRGVNLKNGKLDLNEIVKIDKSISNKLRRSKLYKGDLLMSYAGSVGMVAVVDENNKYHLAPNVAKISIYNLNPHYYCYFMLSNVGQVEIDLLKNKNAQESISMENIRKIRVPVCSQDEQANIVKYLDEKTLEIDTLIYKIQEQIDILKKAKQKLIIEVVTGKIDVTNL